MCKKKGLYQKWPFYYYKLTYELLYYASSDSNPQTLLRLTIKPLHIFFGRRSPFLMSQRVHVGLWADVMVLIGISIIFC